MVEIRQFNGRALKEFIHSVEYDRLTDVPITRHRAISQLNNPAMDKEDVLLLIAYSEGQLMGYVGILPDKIYRNQDSELKFGWLTALWVSPDGRGQGIGLQLMNKALEFWNDRILSADYVTFTKKLYDKTGKFHPEPMIKNGIRWYVRADLSEILSVKRGIFRKTKGLLTLIDRTANVLIDLRLRLSKRPTSSYIYEYVTSADDEAMQFIFECNKKELYRRDGADINWILQYPWVLSRDCKNEEDNKYYFSSSSKKFEFKLVKIKDHHGALIALLLFSLRNGSLKLPYYWHIDHLKEVAFAVKYHILKWKVNTFTSYEDLLYDALTKENIPAVLSRNIHRNYMVSKVLSEAFLLKPDNIRDGDGDCVFT